VSDPVPETQIEVNSQKFDGYAAGYGSVIFFEDQVCFMYWIIQYSKNTQGIEGLLTLTFLQAILNNMIAKMP